jgi:hypothetical protein
MEIRETQIEDILVAAPELAKNILGFDENPKLIGRQIIIPSGRLDILYTYNTSLYLIELKITAFQNKFIHQVLGYKKDLEDFQKSGKLINGEIKPCLLLPKIDVQNSKLAQNNGVKCYEYNPDDILKFFYNEKLKPITSFVGLKPIDIGIWNIHLINKFIYSLEKTESVKELQCLYSGAQKTLYNKIKFANELGLVDWKPNRDAVYLTALGISYINAMDKVFSEKLSELQITILRNYIMQNPYNSSITVGIASLVESVFVLSKNTYPVELSQLIECFTRFSGKIYDWQTPKAQFSGTKMYSNYAVDLGLLAKSNENVYLTPDGFKFVIQMQLHKSLILMNNLTVI